MQPPIATPTRSARGPRQDARMPPLTQHENLRSSADPLPNVLVVEDEPVTRRYLQAALEKTGKYVVHAAEERTT